jgi:peptidoglycan/LPS O-acetylase OafA/YrhL
VSALAGFCALACALCLVPALYRLHDDDVDAGALAAVVNGAHADVILVISASLLVLAVCASPVVQRALETRAVLYLGKISFAMYLLHTTIIFSVGCAIVNSASDNAYGGMAALAFVAMWAVLVPMSHLFTEYVDTMLAVKGVRSAYTAATDCATKARPKA